MWPNGRKHVGGDSRSFEKESYVCLVKKSVYGLKNRPLKRNQRFTSFVEERRLVALKSDSCSVINDFGTLFVL